MKKIATWMLVFFGLAAWCSAAEVNGTQMCPRPKDTESTEVRVPTNTSEHKKPQTDNPTTTSPTDERRDVPKEEDDHPILTVLFEQVLPDLIDILIHPENHRIEDTWSGPGPKEKGNDGPNRNTDPAAHKDGPPIVNNGPGTNVQGPPIVDNGPGTNVQGPPIVDNGPGTDIQGPPIVKEPEESPLEQAIAYLIDAGLGEGTTVGDMADMLADVIAGKFDGNMPSAEDIVQAALEEGRFGGSDGGIVGDTSNLPSIGGCFGGDGEDGSGTFDPWGAILDKAKTTTLKKLESWTTKQLDAWINKHPTVQKWFSILGIDGSGIVNGVKNIWGVLTGNGTLAEKFAQLASMAQNALCDMATHALKYGLDKLGQWLSGIAQKWIGKAMSWLKGKLDKLLGGKIKIPDKLLAKFQAQLNNLVGRGIGKAVDWAKSQGEKIIDGMRPGDPSSQGGENGTTTVGELGK